MRAISACIPDQAQFRCSDLFILDAQLIANDLAMARATAGEFLAAGIFHAHRFAGCQGQVRA